MLNVLFDVSALENEAQGDIEQMVPRQAVCQSCCVLQTDSNPFHQNMPVNEHIQQVYNIIRQEPQSIVEDLTIHPVRNWAEWQSVVKITRQLDADQERVIQSIVEFVILENLTDEASNTPTPLLALSRWAWVREKHLGP